MIVSGELENVPLLDVLQVLAYSKQTGLLSVEGASASGAILFQEGGVVASESSATRALLERTAREAEPGSRRTLRWVQALACLAELLALRQGVFRFKRLEGPAPELGGVDVRTFYASGPLDTGELLVALASTVDRPQKSESPPPPAASARPRSHPRVAPTLISAEVSVGSSKIPGYLTNLSLGGAFFDGEALPEVGAVCRVRFDLPHGVGTVDVEARVAWERTESTETGRKGAGLQFHSMSEEYRERLTRYLGHFRQLAEQYRQS